jgi:hypothetical protein
MNLSIFGRLVDERFLNHRLRSSSLGGVIGGIVAIILFAYRFTSTASGVGTFLR